ncbi:UV DNA damage repair endonuclease UvsE [Dethiobacter alkaliphilus]|uniref:UV DNA damage repair endonuclease UvsE n=1 Tax=Dethiobacter alkaliphilus TaxID=427926 RepID=UPI002227BE3B|nr:UV DNA damage repair endonuclease UvsE [Dethiobacter alkaliphilus]MCW3490988.1 UV DNA damage repair endonuclease UvsE [Dethiobacter alkaliphilus]
MLLRFGFVAMSMKLENASPSKTVTLKTFAKLAAEKPEAALEKVRRTAEENLANCLRLLHYCHANHVRVFRFSSRIVPLATHPDLSHWDYLGDLGPQLAKLGDFIESNGMRITFHPDHYTVLNSPREDVFTAAVADLAHHCRLFQAMGLTKQAKLILHVGGSYGDKEEALERFLANWARLPRGIAKRMTLENDDKTFTATDTLYLCEKLQLPMVLDLHHFHCNHTEEEQLEDIFPRVVATWEGSGLPPKLHVSSPKCEKEFRSHHDFVDPEAILPALQKLKSFTGQAHVMVEAKQKDVAMFRLVQELARQPGMEQLDAATIRVN